MSRRILADVVHAVRHVPLEESSLDQFFGVGIYRDPVAQLLQPLDAIDQSSHVVDRPVGERTDRLDKLGFRAIGQLQAKRDLLAVEHVDECLAVAIGLRSCRDRKSPFHAMQHVQNMLARAEGVRAKIGTGTERIAPFFPAHATR